ncbi:Mitochondrial carrier protein [Hondaea fermentalgiana]|uniref:Mitochondrial carrier protein n=1 Tax=Hondaea fermentalgiana TaxID=2315210 RepID=A0A2R5GEE7_9STRA|nr:Mitochondrial carrier protein [Hondaea fermentalgiana]|eukprot:GBG29327.1 Mitochondrial carrier protein [Hondaea fermentalgiana]
MELAVDFAAGAAYGFTSVVVGQPLDTVKSRVQAMSSRGMIGEARSLFATEGVRGLYRGSAPVFLGGTLFRSAQFGVYSTALTLIHENMGKQPRALGFFDVQVAVAGLCGGIGRGLIEQPFDFIKIRRQVDQPWKFSEVFKGSSVTMMRNAGLFCGFVTYIDFSKQLFPDGQLGSFLTGAICSNLAWVTIWPLDVAKSMRQSGLYKGRSTSSLIFEVFRTGRIFRGIVPGLARSFLANGFAMMAYSEVQKQLTPMIEPTFASSSSPSDTKSS